MTNDTRPGTRIICSLRAADGAGVVRMQDRYDTDIDDLWSALTDPDRLARWFGDVSGDLRPGGAFRLYLPGDEWHGGGRVQSCEPPRRLQVTNKEDSEPNEKLIEATLTGDGEQTTLVIEVRGMPLDKIAFYGAGWQIHAENLATYLAGRQRGDIEARWSDLVPAYRDLAANIS